MQNETGVTVEQLPMGESQPTDYVHFRRPGDRDFHQSKQDFLSSAPILVDTIDGMRAIDRPKTGMAAQVTTTGRAGLFRWQSGDLSAECAADPERLVYVPSDDDPDGETGAWVLVGPSYLARQYADAAADAAKDYTNEVLSGISSGAPMFATVQDGLDGTDEGVFFSVPSTVSTEYLALYKHEAGAAKFIDSFPNKTAVQQAVEANIQTRADLASGGLEVFVGDGPVIPIVLDSSNRIVLGFNKESRRLVGAFSAYSNRQHLLLSSISGVTRISGKKIVITGDSLSYNPHGFVAITNQASQAPPGVGAWSYLLRDAIHRNDPFFRHADELGLIDNAGGALHFINPAPTKFLLPFNGIAVRFEPDTASDYIEFEYKHMGPSSQVYIHTLLTSDSKDCTFDVRVDGILKVSGFSTAPTTGFYAGLTPAAIPVPDVPNNGQPAIIRITNATPNGSNEDSVIYICGVSAKYTPVDLTGYGGQASDWLLSNLQTRVIDYDPDIVFCIIGANDHYKGLDADQTEANLRAIVSSLRTHNPLMNIVFLSPPLSDESLTPNSFMVDVHDRMERVCAETGCYFYSVQRLFERVNITDYRYDSIHFSKAGNNLIALDLIARTIGPAVICPELIDSNTNYFAGATR